MSKADASSNHSKIPIQYAKEKTAREKALEFAKYNVPKPGKRGEESKDNSSRFSKNNEDMHR
jgi:hypothetical protein